MKTNSATSTSAASRKAVPEEGRDPHEASQNHGIYESGTHDSDTVPRAGDVILFGPRKEVENSITLATNNHLLTAKEVASRLRVSERWVRDHTTRRNPKIRAVKLGSLIRYRWKDVEEFLEHQDTLYASRRKTFRV